MKKAIMLSIFFLSFILCTGFKRYYIETDSEEKAQEVASICNGELESFADGVGVIVIEEVTTNSDLPFTTARAECRELNVNLRQDHYCKKVDAVDIAPYTNEYYEENQESMRSIKWMNTYKNNITGQGVNVAVIDTGCMTKHEDLKANIIGTYNATNGTKKVSDADGHGTHVSGIIAAADNTVGIVGVAPDSKLYIMKVMSDDGYMYYSSIIRALKKCISLGNISVINMSLGGTFYDAEFEKAVKACDEDGILCVSAAGNSATDKPMYPAAFGIGLRVASYNPGTTRLSYFSNYGQNSDIAAPGEYIQSTYIGGEYETLSGTSMAAPYVTGLAALVYSNTNVRKDSIGTAYVKNLILSNNDGKVYKFKGHSVVGGIDVQKIFNSAKIKTPEKPTITVKEQKDTKQQLVTLSGDGDIYYTIDGKDPSVYSKKYKSKIHIDEPGVHRIRAICANKRSYSYTITKKVVVDDDVITQERIKSVELRIEGDVKPGKTYSVRVINAGMQLPNSKFKWSVNKSATIDKDGNVTVNKSAKKNDMFVITAKLGSFTRTLDVKIK